MPWPKLLRARGAVAAALLLGACADPAWDAYLDNMGGQAESPSRDAARWRGTVVSRTGGDIAALLDDPRVLLGLQQDQVSALLGAPIFVRVDHGAAIWQYHRDNCVLHVFLYALDGDQTSRVAHYELRDDSDGLPITDASAQRRCVSVLTAQHPA
jgi:hypothetical protein